MRQLPLLNECEPRQKNCFGDKVEYAYNNGIAKSGAMPLLVLCCSFELSVTNKPGLKILITKLPALQSLQFCSITDTFITHSQPAAFHHRRCRRSVFLLSESPPLRNLQFYFIILSLWRFH